MCVCHVCGEECVQSSCVYVHICMYVCMYMCTYVCMYVYVHICMYVCMSHIGGRPPMDPLCVCVLCVCMYVFACVYLWTLVPLLIDGLIDSHDPIRALINVYTHMHGH